MATSFLGALETHTCVYTSHDATLVHCNIIPVLQTGSWCSEGAQRVLCVKPDPCFVGPFVGSTLCCQTATCQQLEYRLQYVEVYTTAGTLFVGRRSLLGRNEPAETYRKCGCVVYLRKCGHVANFTPNFVTWQYEWLTHVLAILVLVM